MRLENYLCALFFLRMDVETFNLKDLSKKSSKQQFFFDMIFWVLDFLVNESRIVGMQETVLVCLHSGLLRTQLRDGTTVHLMSSACTFEYVLYQLLLVLHFLFPNWVYLLVFSSKIDDLIIEKVIATHLFLTFKQKWRIKTKSLSLKMMFWSS